MTASATNLVNWDAESVRLTMFTLVPTPGPDALLAVWKRLTDGRNPDESISKPAAGLYQAAGAVDGEHLLVASNPGRIDILSIAVPAGGDSPVSAAVIGPASDVVGRFVKRAENVLSDTPSIHRLAFGAVLLGHDVLETREEGYQALARILKTVEIDPAASDLLYQINRPRPASSGLGVASFNRLSKWSVNSVTFLPVLSSGMQAPIHLRSFRPRLEIDMSTPADHGKEIASKELPRVLAALVELGLEIAAKGDLK